MFITWWQIGIIVIILFYFWNKKDKYARFYFARFRELSEAAIKTQVYMNAYKKYTDNSYLKKALLYIAKANPKNTEVDIYSTFNLWQQEVKRGTLTESELLNEISENEKLKEE